jgi:hypothetical protein
VVALWACLCEMGHAVGILWVYVCKLRNVIGGVLVYIQGVPGGMCQTSGECSLG